MVGASARRNPERVTTLFMNTSSPPRSRWLTRGDLERDTAVVRQGRQTLIEAHPMPSGKDSPRRSGTTKTYQEALFCERVTAMPGKLHDVVPKRPALLSDGAKSSSAKDWLIGR